MSKRILLVVHDDGPRDDRASDFLERQGAQLEWTCPALGGALPSPKDGFDAALVYGGLQSANSHDENAYIRREIDWIADWVEEGKSFLGLCLGGQLLAHALGAPVTPHPEGLHERGFIEVQPTQAGRAVMEESLHVYQAHYEGFELPEGAELLLTGATFPHQGFRFGRTAYGFQFHPECTPEMMVRWMDMDGEEMNQPGAHPRERQIADSDRHDQPMADWFLTFLARWIADEL